MIGPDFYPTPSALIRRMLAEVNINLIADVLEPSAGKGDICDFLRSKTEYRRGRKLDIDAIEIDPTLQHILRGKGYPVIHDDFMTFRTNKRYDLIVANFPFSSGADHLAKALAMLAENGGTLVCLVNAETLRNTYTRQRQAIADMLDHHGATIEFLSEEFADAERRTDVEVALIRLTLPRPKRVSLVLDDLRDAAGWDRHVAQTDALVDADPMRAMVQRFDLECAAGVRLIDEYQALRPYLLDGIETGGEADKYRQPLLTLSVKDGSAWNGATVNDYVRGIRAKYWRALLRNERFQRAYTSNILDELEFQLKRLEECDFTLFNIMQLEAELRTKVGAGVEDAILKMFDTFTSRYAYHDYSKNIHYFNGWRTNKAHKINRKVILPINGFSAFQWGGTLRLDTFGIAKEITDLVKAFDFLAGTPTPLNAGAVLETASRTGQFRDIDFHYFTATFYKKGTCHLTFSDQRLLDKLNIYGSQRKGWLPPSYGRKPYADMDTEEQAVVDSFQGRSAYGVVLNDRAFYLAGPTIPSLASGLAKAA